MQTVTNSSTEANDISTVPYIYNDQFELEDFPFSEYPIEKEPVWTWANALLGDFEEEQPQELNLLNKDEEYALFMHMNWHLHQFNLIIQRAAEEERDLTDDELSKAEAHRAISLYAREQMALFNLGMIFGVCKKFNGAQKAEYLNAQDQRSECLTTLLNCIDKFNASFGFKFSTYFYKSAIKKLSRHSKKEHTVLSRFAPLSRFSSTDADTPSTLLEEGDNRIQNAPNLETRLDEFDPDAVSIVYSMLEDISEEDDGKLTRVEQVAFLHRYASEEPMTLQQIGEAMGSYFRRKPYTRERVRIASMMAAKKIRNEIQKQMPDVALAGA